MASTRQVALIVALNLLTLMILYAVDTDSVAVQQTLSVVGQYVVGQ
ncbi:MAG: hypothetical protein JSW10_03185 [Pseudomonadota bacterium]|nr:MAG: hypothetical protein JSW10_03185 [Pseudomonadota bacterium]